MIRAHDLAFSYSFVFRTGWNDFSCNNTTKIWTLASLTSADGVFGTIPWCNKNHPAGEPTRLKQTKWFDWSPTWCQLRCGPVMDGVLWGWSHTSHSMCEKFTSYLWKRMSLEWQLDGWYFFVHTACGMRWFHVVARPQCSFCFAAISRVSHYTDCMLGLQPVWGGGYM